MPLLAVPLAFTRTVTPPGDVTLTYVPTYPLRSIVHDPEPLPVDFIAKELPVTVVCAAHARARAVRMQTLQNSRSKKLIRRPMK